MKIYKSNKHLDCDCNRCDDMSCCSCYPGPGVHKGFLKDPQGEPSSGAIIPFSSGPPVTLTTIADGLVGTPAFVGFGSSVPGISIVGGTIDLTNSQVL